jgi:hypothetical protein
MKREPRLAESPAPRPRHSDYHPDSYQGELRPRRADLLIVSYSIQTRITKMFAINSLPTCCRDVELTDEKWLIIVNSSSKTTILKIDALESKNL